MLVKIRSCGFCATDYKAIKGIRRNVSFPLVPGHEPAGIVAAVGAGVRNVKEGDEVIIQPSGYCGLCHYCRLGLTHYCEHAYTTGGDGPKDVWHGSFSILFTTTPTPGASNVYVGTVIYEVAVTNNVATFKFPTSPGHNYRVEYKTNLTDVAWGTLVDRLATTDAIVITDPLGANQRRFYRVRALD